MSKELTKADALKAEKLLPQINANHRECMKCGKDAVNHAVEAGDLLLQLKECVKHGDFESTVEKRCDFAVRTAQSYMKLSAGLQPLLKHQGKELGSDATIGGCLKLITESKKADKPKAQSLRFSPTPGGNTATEGENASPSFGKKNAAPFVDPIEAACEHDYDDEACRKCHAPKQVEQKPGPSVVSPAQQTTKQSSDSAISGGITFNTEEFKADAKDAFGDEAPDDLRATFELCAGFDEQLGRLSLIKTWITQNENHPGAVVLASAASRLRADLKQATNELKFAKPYCVCVYCHNKNPKVADCNACKGLGWITEPIYKAAPKGMQREKSKG